MKTPRKPYEIAICGEKSAIFESLRLRAEKPHDKRDRKKSGHEIGHEIKKGNAAGDIPEDIPKGKESA